MDTSTGPVAGTIGAIFKFDSDDYPDTVYNEIVALRLAQLIRFPIAEGCLVRTGGGNAFASLELAEIGIPIPIVTKYDSRLVAWRYPELCGALVVFDIWIGNGDRDGNIKATIGAPAVHVFRGFDHADALLNCRASRSRSIKLLGSKELVVESHPLYGHLSMNELDPPIKRIGALPERFIREACCFGETFGQITTHMQEKLSRALIERALLLPWLIGENQHVICKQ